LNETNRDKRFQFPESQELTFKFCSAPVEFMAKAIQLILQQLTKERKVSEAATADVESASSEACAHSLHTEYLQQQPSSTEQLNQVSARSALLLHDA
jgi:Tfp pilus assembly PilM family ATPase